MKLVFESTEENQDLFNLRSFQSICDIETTIIRPSLLPYLKGLSCQHMISLPILTAAYSKKTCGGLTEVDITSMRNLLADCYPYFKSEGMDPKAPEKCKGKDNMVHNIFYYLTDVNFKPTHNDSSKLTYTNMVYSVRFPHEKSYFQSVFEGKDISHGSVKLVSFYAGLDLNVKYSLFSDYLEVDLMNYIGFLACGLILSILFIYLFSFVLAAATFCNVLFSFTTAYVIYYYVLGITFFPFINILAALILVAVGADDVFIFYDAWKQAEKDDEYVPLQNRVGRAFSHAAASIAVTSLTTSASFFANYITNIVCIKCFALFAGLAILTNFVYMVTWTPSIIIGIHIVQNWFLKVMRELGIECIDTVMYGTNAIMRYRAKVSRAIFDQCLPWLIEKLWFVWIPLLLIVGVGGLVTVFYYPRLQLPKSKEFQLFPTHQYMEYWDQNMRSEFQFVVDAEDKYKIPLYFVWGYLPRDNGKWFDHDDLGHLVVDTEFDFFSKESQSYLKKFVDNLWSSDFVHVDAGVKNDNLSFYEAVEHLLEKCKLKDGKDGYFELHFRQCCNETKMPFSREFMDRCMPALSFGVPRYVKQEKSIGMPIFDQSNNLTAYMIEIMSNKFFTTSYEEMDEFYIKVDKFIRAQNEMAPVGLKHGFVSGKYEFLFYALQKAIASGTYFSILLSLGAAALLMLLTSLNLLLTFYAMVTITLAIAVTIGCFVLLGWHLNIVESITISLAVGLSIDFTIHYGMSYRLSKEKYRLARTRESFSRVGSAIVMAALTTFAAGAAMMPSRIVPYLQLGIFLMVVMAFSWLYATFFFMSICRIIGPNGKFCQIPILCGKKRNSTAEEEENAENTYRHSFVNDPTLALDSLERNASSPDAFILAP